MFGHGVTLTIRSKKTAVAKTEHLNWLDTETVPIAKWMMIIFCVWKIRAIIDEQVRIVVSQCYVTIEIRGPLHSTTVTLAVMFGCAHARMIPTRATCSLSLSAYPSLTHTLTHFVIVRTLGTTYNNGDPSGFPLLFQFCRLKFWFPKYQFWWEVAFHYSDHLATVTFPKIPLFPLSKPWTYFFPDHRPLHRICLWSSSFTRHDKVKDFMRYFCVGILWK